MNKTKSRGPRMEPCGTPDNTVKHYLRHSCLKQPFGGGFLSNF